MDKLWLLNKLLVVLCDVSWATDWCHPEIKYQNITVVIELVLLYK